MLAQRLCENHLKHELMKEAIKEELATEKKLSEQGPNAQAFIKAKAYGLICTWVLNAERSDDDIRSHLETDAAAKAFIEKYNLYFDSVTFLNRYHVISSLTKGVYLADVEDVVDFVKSL